MDYFHPHFAKETTFQRISNVIKLHSEDLRSRVCRDGMSYIPSSGGLGGRQLAAGTVWKY